MNCMRTTNPNKLLTSGADVMARQPQIQNVQITQIPVVDQSIQTTECCCRKIHKWACEEGEEDFMNNFFKTIETGEIDRSRIVFKLFSELIMYLACRTLASFSIVHCREVRFIFSQVLGMYVVVYFTIQNGLSCEDILTYNLLTSVIFKVTDDCLTHRL